MPFYLVKFLIFKFIYQIRVLVTVGIGACGEINKADEFIGAMVSIIQRVGFTLKTYESSIYNFIERYTIWRVLRTYFSFHYY